MYTYPMKSNHLQQWKLATNVVSVTVFYNINDIYSKIMIISLTYKKEKVRKLKTFMLQHYYITAKF